MNSTLQIRIDKQTKRESGEDFQKMGIDTSSGVKMFLSQVVNYGAIPFVPTTQNGFSAEREKRVLAETKTAIRSGKRYRSDTRGTRRYYENVINYVAIRNCSYKDLSEVI